MTKSNYTSQNFSLTHGQKQAIKTLAYEENISISAVLIKALYVTYGKSVFEKGKTG